MYISSFERGLLCELRPIVGIHWHGSRTLTLTEPDFILVEVGHVEVFGGKKGCFGGT